MYKVCGSNIMVFSKKHVTVIYSENDYRDRVEFQ